MDPKSTTPADNPTNNDAPAEGTTVTDPQAGTDNQQTANTSDNLDPSKSDDTTVADDDKSTTDKTDDTPASTFDADIDDWAVKKGYPKPENDEQRQAYQDARNEQREFTKTRQAEKAASDAKALGDEVHNSKPAEEDEDDDELDPVEKRVKELEADRDAERTTRMQSEYITANNVSTEEVAAMGKVLKEMIDKEDTVEDKKAAHKYWTDPKRLEQWHRLAKASMATPETDTQIAVDEAQQAERERIAKESKANSPGRGAKVATSGAKTPEQQRLERFSKWD